jgi:hypothetical protein
MIKSKLTIHSSRKYPSFRQISKEMMDNKRLFVVLDEIDNHPYTISMDKIVGVVNNIKEKKHKTVVVWEPFKKLKIKKYEITPVGYGTCNNSDVIDYTLICFKLTPKDDKHNTD